MEVAQKFLNRLNTQLNDIYNNPYVASVLVLLIVLYSGLAAPQLPPVLAGLFGNPIFKVLSLFLILFLRNFNPTLAILVAVGFVLSLQTFHRYQSFSMLTDLSKQESAARVVEAVAKPAHGKPTGSYDPAKGYFFNAAADQHLAADDPNRPLPQQPQVGHLPPIQSQDTQVSGLAAQSCNYLGPQGLQHPYGFGGPVDGASYGREHSEL